MIDLKAPERTRPGDSPVDRLRANDRHVAGRSRLNATDGLTLHYRTWVPVGRRPEAAGGRLVLEIPEGTIWRRR